MSEPIEVALSCNFTFHQEDRPSNAYVELTKKVVQLQSKFASLKDSERSTKSALVVLQHLRILESSVK